MIGPFNSGCTQYQLANFNRAPGGPVPIVSPANTHSGFTRAAESPPDGYRGEPDVYYPTGTRNYLRVVGRETLQGVALAMTANRLGLDRLYVLEDDTELRGGPDWARIYVRRPLPARRPPTAVGIAGRERYEGRRHASTPSPPGSPARAPTAS